MAAYNGSMNVPSWVLALAIALPLTVVLAGSLRAWAPRWGLVDATDGRKTHHGDVPIGGPAVIVGVGVAIVPVMMDAPGLGWWLLGALTVGMGGLVDDRRSLPPLGKLAIQIGAACLALPGGLSVSGVGVFGLDLHLHLGLAGFLLLILWTVGATNAFNLADGLDGLACGVAVLLSATVVAMGALSGEGMTVAIGCALGASALGFLAFNRHPARLFLGDGGSYFLGFLLALTTLQAAQPEKTGVMPAGVLAVLWGYPIVDTIWAILRRAKAKRPILSPDRAHLHHRLLHALGRYRATVGVLYLLSLLLASGALALWMIGR